MKESYREKEDQGSTVSGWKDCKTAYRVLKRPVFVEEGEQIFISVQVLIPQN
jgi:hypothetical protein